MNNIRTCEYCGNKFTITNKLASRSKYCSTYCANHEELNCIICGTAFERSKASSKRTCSKECRKKLLEKTTLDKYGVKNVSQSKNIQKKKEDTTLKNYGVKHPAQNKEVINKMKQTSLERYGVDNANKLETIKNKVKQTQEERYGGWYAGTEKVRKSKSSKMKDKWNNDNYREFYKQAVNEKLGSDYVWGSDRAKEKRAENNIEKYGVDNPFKSKEVQDQIIQTNLDRYGVKNPLQNKNIQEKMKQTNLEKYGVPYYVMTRQCRESQGGTISKINKEIGNLLNIKGEDYEFCLDSKNYDLKKGKVLIEIDPWYTHNSTEASHFSKFTTGPKDKKYHYNKTKTALKNGYNCIHIFDWDDLDKIKDILQNKKVLNVNNLKLKEVEEIECNEFLNKYHLQNTCNNQSIRLGLYKDNELVQVMTFSKIIDDYELLRVCTHKDYKIKKGYEETFKYFINKYNPESVISYCDNSKRFDDMYSKLGFILKEESDPKCHWYNPKTKDHIITDDINIEGYVGIYDCGYNTYVWNNPSNYTIQEYTKKDILDICLKEDFPGSNKYEASHPIWNCRVGVDNLSPKEAWNDENCLNKAIDNLLRIYNNCIVNGKYPEFIRKINKAFEAKEITKVVLERFTIAKIAPKVTALSKDSMLNILEESKIDLSKYKGVYIPMAGFGGIVEAVKEYAIKNDLNLEIEAYDINKEFCSYYGWTERDVLKTNIETDKIVIACPPFGKEYENWNQKSDLEPDEMYSFKEWCDKIIEHIKAPNYILIGPTDKNEEKIGKRNGLFAKKVGIKWYPEYTKREVN